MEGGRVNHRRYMCVVCHGYYGLGWVGMEVVVGKHVGQSQGRLSHVGRCRSTSRVRGDTLMTPDHSAFQVRSSG